MKVRERERQRETKRDKERQREKQKDRERDTERQAERETEERKREQKQIESVRYVETYQPTPISLAGILEQLRFSRCCYLLLSYLSLVFKNKDKFVCVDK